MNGEASVWQAEHAWTGFAPLEGSILVDVAVVGAGITGVACAWRLAELGAEVAVLDARTVAGGASGRNGGFASTGSGLQPERLVGRLGLERARGVRRMTERAFDRMLQLAVEVGAGPAVRRTGGVWLTRPEEETGLRRSLAAMRAIDVEHEVGAELVPPAMRHRFSTGVLICADGELQPVAWVRALASAAARRGVAVFEHSPVRAVTSESDGWVRLDTGTASVRADRVVVACDGLTTQLLPELAGALRPVRGQMLVTGPLAHPPVERPTHSDDGFMYYRPLVGGRLAIGGARNVERGAEETDSERVTDGIQAAIESFMADAMGLAHAGVQRRWAGIMGFSFDMLPVVGEVPGRRGVFVSAGYSGVGNIPGFLCGEALADIIAGRPRPDMAPYSIERLKPGAPGRGTS